jgi:hypothetical protein
MAKKKNAAQFVANQSKIKTWLNCQQAAHYKYTMDLVPNKKSRPLTFGGIVHNMIEAHANGDDPFAVLAKEAEKQGKLSKTEVELYGDIVQDTHDIMTDYFRFYGEKSLQYIRFQKRSAEHIFGVEIADGITFKGKIDAFAKTPNGLRWLVEHKSWGKSIPNEDERWRNVQAPVYTRAIEMMGWPKVDGVLWDYIRSKPPMRPQILKNGQPSKRALDTIPARVERWIAEYKEETGQNADTKHLMKSAEKNRSRYFQRIFTPTKKDVVDKVFADFRLAAIRMRDSQGSQPCKNIGRHCSWCSYESLCRAELRGGDVDFIIEREYRVEKDEHRYEVDAE